MLSFKNKDGDKNAHTNHFLSTFIGEVLSSTIKQEKYTLMYHSTRRIHSENCIIRHGAVCL
jgi:hypothetical protein